MAVGKPSTLAAAVTAHHDTLDAVRPAQRLGGGHHVTGVDAGPDVGRREGDGLVAVGVRHTSDMLSTANPNRSPALRSMVDVAGRLLAEGEVLADHDLDDVQPLDQQFVDVALGRQLHEVGGERHDQEDVDAHFLDQLGAPGQRGQLRRMAAGEDDFHRVRVEGHQHRRDAAGPARPSRRG